MPYQSLKKAGLETVMSHCHLEVDLTTWSTIEMVKLSTKAVREEVASLMKLDSFDKTSQACSIVALSTLILIGKNVTDQNRAGWFRNRWRALALANVVNVIIDDNRIEPPLLQPCRALYSSASSNQPVRGCLFRVMRTLANITEDQTHIIFDRIIHLLQWAEMSHVWMIMEHIYDRNPDVLTFPKLGGPEIAAMSVAIDFLLKYPKGDRPYLKLLFDHNDLKPLHSANFVHFTAAAHAISSLTRSSMLNMNTRNSERVKAFQNRIIAYVAAKAKTGALTAGLSYSSTLPPLIQDTLIRSLEDVAGPYNTGEFTDRQPEVRE